MNLVPALAAIIPSLGVGLIFWVAIRALMNADRSERAALARMEAQDRQSVISNDDGRSSSSGHDSESERI